MQLKYKGNQKQFELNAELNPFLKISKSRVSEAKRICHVSRRLAEEVRQLFCKRQKLIKIADKSKDGWQVVAGYKRNELASGFKVKNASKKPGRW